MSGVILQATPPADWAARCASREFVFHSSQWTGLLEASFNVKTHYVLDAAGQCGAAVSSFPAGPFRIGYWGFPFGGSVGGAPLVQTHFDELRASGSDLLPTAIRIPVSAFDNPVDLAFNCVRTPETAIADLSTWTLDLASENHRRDIKKAIKSGLTSEDASRTEDGATIYGIYQDTVKRHRGGLRYNKSYFTKLIELAQSDPRVRVRLARLDGEIAGFVVAIRHGSVACYLHGGLRLQFRQYRPSALLLSEAIAWAQGCGCKRFNFMSSPADQHSLIRYKEKWGAETREHRTYTIPIRSSFPFFRVAEQLYRVLR